MKKIVALFAISFAFVACTNEGKVESIKEFAGDLSKANHIEFGESFESTNAKVYGMESFDALTKGKENVQLTLAGKVSKVCKKKGCWMSLKKPNGEEIHVSYDYKFLLPLNVDGRDCVVNGNVYNDTTSVAYLQEIARDSGKSEEEVNKITEPKIQKSILASTVWIKK